MCNPPQWKTPLHLPSLFQIFTYDFQWLSCVVLPAEGFKDIDTSNSMHLPTSRLVLFLGNDLTAQDVGRGGGWAL